MPIYVITTYDHNGDERGSITRRQKPAAFTAFQNAVYDAIKAQAGLDTHWGRRAWAQSEGAAENTRSYDVQVRDTRVSFRKLV